MVLGKSIELELLLRNMSINVNDKVYMGATNLIIDKVDANLSDIVFDVFDYEYLTDIHFWNHLSLIT